LAITFVVMPEESTIEDMVTSEIGQISRARQVVAREAIGGPPD
jgi:hypothetical protein